MKQEVIAFFENSHTYWLAARKIPSVGSVIGQIFPDFNDDYWLNHGVFKALYGEQYSEHYSSFGTYMPDPAKLFPKFLEMTDASLFISEKKKLSEQWERNRIEAAYKGTRFHNMAEARAYEQGFLVNPWDNFKYAVSKYPKEYDNQSIVMNLADLPDGAYPELVIFDLDLNVAGQADEVYIQTVGDIRYVDINDHKTNEKKPSKSDPHRCYSPFEDKYASKDFRYTVQINTYAYLMTRYGFTVRNMAYTHYKKYDPATAERVDVENVIDRLKLFFEKRK
jgi:hypothetical protein